MRQIVLLIACLMFCQIAASQKKIAVASPDGRLKFTLSVDGKGLSYRVSYKGKAVVDDSSLGFDFDSGPFGAGLKVGSVTRSQKDETYELVVGKVKQARSHYREVIVPLQEKEAPKRTVHLVVRAFNDGVAFRYEFPGQKDWQSYVMYDEKTSFHPAGDPKALVMFLPSYTTSHEGLYTYVPYSEVEERKLMDMPALFTWPDGVCLAITEAAVVNYAGMYLMKEGGALHGKLSPHPGQERIKVVMDLPHHTPWRVLSVSDRVGALIESNILTHLNEPCKIEDTSWIHPGKTTFTWWNGNVVPDTTFQPGNNFLTNKYYIDFAARNGLDYHSVYGYAEQPWYVDDGFAFGFAGPNADVTKPISALNMKQVCDYAAGKGVKIHLWVNWRPLYDKLEAAFRLYHEWGVAGLMVDFMDRDDQDMIRIQEEILQMAARYHLYIQFHGASKPSGLHRTYPNEFTREGTLNYEVFKWDSITTADHDISIPFTRLLAGATDYHLGGFRAVPRSQFKIRHINPLVMSTRCHMLAMYVVLESYLGMVCDTPPSYEGQPGFEFIRKVPVVWDDVRVPDASVNEYVTVARKSGADWYIGSLNNSQARTVEVTLDFLDVGAYVAEIYTDAPDAGDNPNHLVKKQQAVVKGDILRLPLAADGGAVVHVMKQ